MPIFRRDPEKHLNDIHDKMVAKSGLSFASTLRNEMASAKTQTPLSSYAQETYTRAGDHYVFEEAVGLESSRTRGRLDRRSLDQDSFPVRDVRQNPPRNVYQPNRLFGRAGIFGARDRDVQGRKPYGRWPETSIPPRGTPTEHVYQPPTFFQPPVITRGGGHGCNCGDPRCRG